MAQEESPGRVEIDAGILWRRQMDKEAVLEKVKTRLKDGKISCQQARKLAEDEGITYKDMGELLNEYKIKIMSCQLGCF
jgi:LAO/AO transport system kinase